MSASARRRGGEQGIALIWAILIMLIVIGTITVSVGMSLVRTDETRDEAQRTRSSIWMDAAADDLVQRLQSREIGDDLESVPGPNADGRIVVPMPGTSPSGTRISVFKNPGPTTGSTNARQIQFTRNGRTYRGWYQVLPTPGTTTPWRAILRRSGSSTATQGSVEMVVRAWEDGTRARPVVAQLTFRHASFARFALLSDDRLNVGGLGVINPQGGMIHSNNAKRDPVAITLDGPVRATITTTSGAIQRVRGGNCIGGGRCVAGIGDVVEFGAAARAMDRTFQLSSATIATSGASYSGTGVNRYVDVVGNGGANNMPITVVDLAACGANLWIGTGTFPLRNDTVGVPVADDRFAPTIGGGQCYPVAEGGGTYLINGDVLVRGYRGDFRPVTVMAQRRRTFNVLVDTNGDNIAAESARVTSPGSIYLGGGTVGSNSPFHPIGLVAEGGLYAPSYIMVGGNSTMTVNNVAGMAAGGEIGYGPSIISVAAESGQVGLGLSPNAAQALGYGYGRRLDWNGALASRRPIVFRYGTNGNNFLGYADRNFVFPPDMHWSAPPGYPNDRDWHLTDLEEFNR
jgi:hypothetical protein